jgi:hypothetical protein
MPLNATGGTPRKACWPTEGVKGTVKVATLRTCHFPRMCADPLFFSLPLMLGSAMEVGGRCTHHPDGGRFTPHTAPHRGDRFPGLGRHRGRGGTGGFGTWSGGTPESASSRILRNAEISPSVGNTSRHVSSTVPPTSTSRITANPWTSRCEAMMRLTTSSINRPYG